MQAMIYQLFVPKRVFWTVTTNQVTPVNWFWKNAPKINPRRIAYFGDNLPVSTLVEVKGLVDPRMKVEIECQAYVE